MTDPSVPPAPAEDGAKPKFQTVADLEKELFRRAHITSDDDYQQLDRFYFDGQLLIVGQPNPFNHDFVIFAAFHDEDEVRAYEVPHKDAKPKEGQNAVVLRPRRLTYPKGSGKMGPISEIMSFDRLVTLVAEETSVLVNGVQTFMMERLKVVTYLRSIHPATSVPLVVKAIEEGVHAPDEDEDDDETGDQVAQAIANGAPPK